MSDPEAIVAPTVNINGSSKKDLQSQQKTAYIALSDALEAMLKAAPHSRDFQTAPEGAFETARAQHDARLAVVGRLQADYLLIFHGINRK